MSEIVNILKWRLFKRFVLMKKVKGFYSHPISFSCPNSEFDEYSQIKKNGVVKNSRVGRFSRVTGATLNNAIIGSFTSIAPRTFVGGGGEHPLDQVSTHSIFYKSCSYQYPKIRFSDYDKFDDSLKKVIVGNDVWICSDCIIKPGVVIGDGAVIASGSVVVKDVPPYAIYGGVPAKLIRYRHDSDLIAELLRSEWWNWPLSHLKIISKYFDDKQILTLDKFKMLLNEVETLNDV